MKISALSFFLNHETIVTKCNEKENTNTHLLVRIHLQSPQSNSCTPFILICYSLNSKSMNKEEREH